jgi:formylglycine-generating enzyme required for sulfatase activity
MNGTRIEHGRKRMRRIWTVALAAALVAGVGALAGEERGVGGAVRADGTWLRERDIGEVGDYYALVIAIERYGPAEWRLRTPVADGKALAKLLRERYGFKEVTELYDEEATLVGIRRAIVALGRKVGRKDSVLIYYAGHGTLEGGTGFWIPVNAKPGEQWNYLESVAIRDMVKRQRFKAKHVLIVSDSCYGAALFRGMTLPAKVVPEYVRQALRRPARQLLTSGGMAPVADGGGGGHSVFGKYFLKCLSEPPRDVFVVSDLMADLKYNVGNNAPKVGGERQVPILGVLEESGAERGAEFVFIRRPEGKLTVPAEPVRPVERPEPGPVVVGPPAAKVPGWAKVSKAQVAYAEKAGLAVAKELDLGGGVKMKLVLVPPGEFMMGEADGSSWSRPVHKVRITKPFYMGACEVTRQQWKAVMGSEPWYGSPYPGPESTAPANYVSWEDATAFCRKLSEKTGATARLATEAEWEYACRAETKTRFSFGNVESELATYGWYGENSDKTMHPVGGKAPNPWGLYDMHGNLSEWCWDRYDRAYYKSSPKDDPAGPRSGPYRVHRGGGWGSLAERCTSGYRSGFTPTWTNIVVGFRVVVTKLPSAVTVPGPERPVERPEPEPVVAPKGGRVETTAYAAGEAPGWAKVSREQVEYAKRAGLAVAKEWKLGAGVTMRFVLVAPGEFMMGSKAEGGDAPPRRERIAKPFYIGVTEVTQSQYEAATGEKPSKWQGADLPVEQVSWEDAQAFCRKLGAKAGAAVRLPTEAEWEYACRAGTETQWSWGDAARDAEGYGWYLSNGEKRTHAVGQKLPNRWGLYDVHGNVWEWCGDWSGGERKSRVYRGGGWDYGVVYARSSCRNGIDPGHGHGALGFRVVVESAAAPGE